MSSHLPPLRRTAVATSVTTLVLLTACGGPTTPENGEPATARGTASAAGAFPVEVEHTFGRTTVPERPERVVALGVSDADVVLALGTTPVANTGYTFYPDDGLGPWAEGLVEGEPPVLLDSDSEPDLEQLAALEPDLVVAVSSGIDGQTYEQLSLVAPVVARPEGTAPYTAGRTDATRLVAAAMGEGERGEELVAAADAAFDEAVRAHPEFPGSTATAVLPYDGQYGAYLPGDARGQVLDQLGFDLPEAVAALDSGGSFFVPVSAERTDVLDGDALVLLLDDASRPQVESDAVLAQVPVVARGDVVTPDLDLRGAMTYNTVLSAPFAVEGLTPLLAEALAD